MWFIGWLVFGGKKGRFVIVCVFCSFSFGIFCWEIKIFEFIFVLLLIYIVGLGNLFLFFGILELLFVKWRGYYEVLAE